MDRVFCTDCCSSFQFRLHSDVDVRSAYFSCLQVYISTDIGNNKQVVKEFLTRCIAAPQSDFYGGKLNVSLYCFYGRPITTLVDKKLTTEVVLLFDVLGWPCIVRTLPVLSIFDQRFQSIKTSVFVGKQFEQSLCSIFLICWSRFDQVLVFRANSHHWRIGINWRHNYVINSHECVTNTLCLKKRPTFTTCCYFYIHSSIATIFGTNVIEKAGNQMYFIFPTSPN